jgi:hypothetical protein
VAIAIDEEDLVTSRDLLAGRVLVNQVLQRPPILDVSASVKALRRPPERAIIPYQAAAVPLRLYSISPAQLIESDNFRRSNPKLGKLPFMERERYWPALDWCLRLRLWIWPLGSHAHRFILPARDGPPASKWLSINRSRTGAVLVN